jgi:Ca2+-binding EF-hand superfamily protein
MPALKLVQSISAAMSGSGYVSSSEMRDIISVVGSDVDAEESVALRQLQTSLDRGIYTCEKGVKPSLAVLLKFGETRCGANLSSSALNLLQLMRGFLDGTGFIENFEMRDMITTIGHKVDADELTVLRQLKSSLGEYYSGKGVEPALNALLELAESLPGSLMSPSALSLLQLLRGSLDGTGYVDGYEMRNMLAVIENDVDAGEMVVLRHLKSALDSAEYSYGSGVYESLTVYLTSISPCPQAESSCH